MTALTKDRATDAREGHRVNDPLASGAAIFAGGMYMLNATGEALAAAAQGGATTWVVRAVATERASTAAGDTQVEGEIGVFRFGNSASSDEITRADIGAACYAADDQTVAKGSDTGKRPKAGTVFDVDDGGVWVRIGA